AAASAYLPIGHAPAAAQTDDRLAEAAIAARELSVLEAERDFEALYERMHPDALAVVPRSAVVGWYESYFAGRETRELEVTGVEAEPWTWPVTGVTYDDAVTVRFVQPYTVDGVTTDVAGEVHLVPFDDEWGWFFGASRAFVDEQVALYGDDGSATMFSLSEESVDTAPVPREVRFPDPLHADIDRFWEARFQEAGRIYDPPEGVVSFDEPMVTACGRADPEREAAFYCVIDEKIYYSAEFRSLIENQIGDFAWVVVVAHEWGHHVQAKLGFDLGVVPDRAGEVAPIELEQQADCLAGAYAIDAELTGWLDAGDIDEALAITEISGDPPGTAWNDPRAHGTGDVRIDNFLAGYNAGIVGCDLDLSAASPAA
ncbi:MAG TPA: neutral zinc metallopeptidase, partial [Thermomicrobiales bacterium]|nr:neutral zinc metallopeptidase [Thermomicrobiales bacterium]